MKNRLLSDFTKYVSLNVLGMIGLSCYILADTFFISLALGADGLAALTLALPAYNVIHGAGLMLGLGGATQCAVLWARGRGHDARQTIAHTVALGLILGALFLTAGAAFAPQLATLLGAEGAAAPLAADYLRVILCFAPCFLLNNIFLALVRNDRNPRLAMAAMLAGSLSNIVLDYVLMFPLGMGMTGAAVATGLAPLISLGVLSAHARRRDNRLHVSRPHPSRRVAGHIFTLGFFAFVTEASTGLVLMLSNGVILELSGNTGVAAYGIVANLALVFLSVFTGMAQGMQPLASRAFGQGDPQSLRRLLRYASVLSLAAAAVGILAVNVWQDGIISAFGGGRDAWLARIAADGLRLYFPGFLFAGFNMIAAAFLCATGRPRAGSAVSLARGFVAIGPLVLILPRFLGMNGVWLSFGAAELIACVPACLALGRAPSSCNSSSGTL